MFHAMPPHLYPTIQPLFTGFESALIVTAVLEGTSPGQIWVDKLDVPTSCFLHSAEGDFLVGDPHNQAFNAGIKAMIPSLGDDHLVIECLEDWQPTLEEMFDKRVVLEPRLYYQYDQALLDWRTLLPHDVIMVSVDAGFLQQTSLKNRSAVLDWIENNWFSQDDFLKMGFGRCLIRDGVIASWCLVDCVSGLRCEIGIHTDPDYRKQGYGALTVSATIEAAHTMGYTTIGWHCWEHNLASRKVADKVGFRQMHRYPAYVCLHDDASYAIEVGIMAARSGRHREALTHYQMAGDAAWAYFLAARSYGALAEPDAALKLLWKALDHGWAAPEYLLADEFRSLHTLSGWQALLADGRLKAD